MASAAHQLRPVPTESAETLRSFDQEDIDLSEQVLSTSVFEEIVGSSEAIRGVTAQVMRVAPSDATVLITGESGTGKELIARAIHKRSRRSRSVFTRMNCAVTPPSLMAAELFGYEKGAFTGANQRHAGRFEVANHGTIFLDEIGDMPSETQVALLRVLQEREFERVGGTQSIPVDVRVIAATNCDLPSAVRSGKFRLDLFYRLNVFPIHVPPLRERPEDILLLAKYFIERYAAKEGKRIRRVEKRTAKLLTSYHWPGSIRELAKCHRTSHDSQRLGHVLCGNGVVAARSGALGRPAAVSDQPGTKAHRRGACGNPRPHFGSGWSCQEAGSSADDAGIQDQELAH
jgi:transcriptional regulator with GAF, ATPase, and Fis domain